jgi:hypothetical protein
MAQLLMAQRYGSPRLWVIVVAVVAAMGLSWLVGEAVGQQIGQPKPPIPCDRLDTTKGAHERAQKGWNSETVEKDHGAITRVRRQKQCVPQGKSKRFVKRQIKVAKKQYRAAKEQQNLYGGIDPPGEDYLRNLRYCESGSHGLYAANTGNGFYGAYQFTLSTWASVGGSGYPHLASPDEQDYRAAVLWRQQGSSPWPVCG